MSSLKVDTAAGSFSVRLHDDRAPRTCRYFCQLAHDGGLDRGEIFRVTTDENRSRSDIPAINVVQFGTRRGLDEERSQIVHESTLQTGLRHRRFTVSASRFAPGEVYGSFFICMRDEPELDFGGARHSDGQGYAAFGDVDDGSDVLERIFAKADTEEIMRVPIRIHSIKASLVAEQVQNGRGAK